MSRREWIRKHRPNVWFLLPTILAFVMFVQSHKEFVWSAICLTLIVSSYFTKVTLPWPKTRGEWVRFMVWAVIVWFIASTYFDVVLGEGTGLNYYPRFVFKPWIITPSGLWAAVWLACLWHVSFEKEDHTTALHILNGWIILCSGQFLKLSGTYRFILVTYCVVFAITLFVTAFGRRSQDSIKFPKLRHWVSFTIWSFVILVSVWGVIVGLHKAESRLPYFLMQFFRPRLYSGHIGSRDSMMIRRNQNIRLSTTMVAAIRGKSKPGYLRTQVMTRYKRGLWSSPRFEWALPSTLRQKENIVFRLPGAKQHLAKKMNFKVHAFKHLDNSMLLSYGTTHLRLAPKARCLYRMGHSLSCEPNRLLERYSFRRKKVERFPYGTGFAELPGAALLAQKREATYRKNVKRKPGFKFRAKKDAKALADIYKKLRPLALQVVGKDVNKPLKAAQKVQDYFQRNYTYSLQVKLSKKGDPTVDFVLNKRPAFCEYFASGMALMMRSIGIKARVATGFAVKEFNNYSQAWLVRQRDAHAWTEVYDAKGKRWVAYDATAPSMDGWPAMRKSTSSWSDFWAGLQVRWQEWVAWMRKVNLREWLTTQVTKLINKFWHWSTMLILIALWVLIELWRQRVAFTRWLSQFQWFSWLSKEEEPERGPPSQEEARFLLTQLLDLWSEKGWVLGQHETLEEFHKRLKDDPPKGEESPPLESLQMMIPLYNALRFLPVPKDGVPEDGTTITDPHLQELAAKLRGHVEELTATASS